MPPVKKTAWDDARVAAAIGAVAAASQMVSNYRENGMLAAVIGVLLGTFVAGSIGYLIGKFRHRSRT